MDFTQSYAFVPQFAGGFTITTAAPPAPAPAPPAKDCKLGDAIAALLVAKEGANRSEVYLQQLGFSLRAFAKGREDMDVAEITLETIEAWLTERDYGPRSRMGIIGRISSLLSFCIRRGWITENPCRRIEPTFITAAAPRILTVEEARTLLDYTRAHRPEMLAWLALGIFTGIRPYELIALDWPNVDLEKRRVVVDAAISKVSRRRIVEMHPTVVEWLKLCDPSERLTPNFHTARKYRYQLAGALGWKQWKHDLARHTAASYLLALHQDAPKVAYSLGNSPRILMSHYWSLTTKEDAEKFFALRPE